MLAGKAAKKKKQTNKQTKTKTHAIAWGKRENGSLVVQSSGQENLHHEASVILLVIISNQKPFQNLRMQDEQNNESKTYICTIDPPPKWRPKIQMNCIYPKS